MGRRGRTRARKFVIIEIVTLTKWTIPIIFCISYKNCRVCLLHLKQQKPNNVELWSHQELGCLNSKLHNRFIWHRLHHHLSQGNYRPSWTASFPFPGQWGRWEVQRLESFLLLVRYLLTFEQPRDVFLLPVQRSCATYLQNRLIWETALKRLNGRERNKVRKLNLLPFKVYS